MQFFCMMAVCNSFRLIAKIEIEIQAESEKQRQAARHTDSEIRYLQLPLPGIVEIHYFSTSATLFVEKNEGSLIIFKTVNNMLHETLKIIIANLSNQISNYKDIFPI